MSDVSVETLSPPRVRRPESLAGPVHRFAYPLLALVRRDLKRRYATTALGAGWAVLQPLVQLLLYVLVFAFILRLKVRPESGPVDFAVYLLCGMLPYLAMADGIQRASFSLKENRGLLDRAVFPAEVVPAASVISAALAEAIGLLLLGGLAAAFGWRPSAWLLLAPLLVLLRIVLTLGLAWLVSVLSVFVADVAEALPLVLTAWLFLTPIFYLPDVVPRGLGWLVTLNPLHHLVVAYRAVLLEGHNPFPQVLLVVSSATLIGFGGLWFFRTTLPRAKDFL